MWRPVGVVGVGSALFHATLRAVFQAADELPMMYGNLVRRCRLTLSNPR